MKYILPKEYIDTVGARIESLRKTQSLDLESLSFQMKPSTTGRGSNIKTNMEKFDDGRLMALVCRHDIPLFLANIDTPGEQQKYTVALAEHLFSLLPPEATVIILYDVGCILDRSLDSYEFLPRDITRLCSLLATEAPVRLKKELDTILALQSNLDTCQKSLQTTRSTLAKTSASVTSVQILGSLQDHHDQLKEDIEALYSSLTVQESYPELSGVDLEFVKALLVARDLKINVHKRAVGSFFEWDRLDQASGGRKQALGTKLHQATWAAIKKCTPTLMAGLCKYNDLCATLATMYNPAWAVPLPEALPTELKLLQDSPSLMQDVWIS
ncbi:hypothetical protein DXG01_000923 [Tephrocybe rancida]|nr:hypothetical protein DXG01_000923 [Tephrocybe rancida]